MYDIDKFRELMNRVRYQWTMRSFDYYVHGPGWQRKLGTQEEVERFLQQSPEFHYIAIYRKDGEYLRMNIRPDDIMV